MQRVPISRATTIAPAPTVWSLLVALLLALAVVAVPSNAHAYPDPQCTCTISAQKVKGGAIITFTGTSDDPLHWTVRFRSDTRKATGTRFETKFQAPQVDRTTVFPLEVEAAWVTPPAARATTVSGVCRRTFDITVVPASGSASVSAPESGPESGPASAPGAEDDDRDQSVLPNTGGPRMALLGLALLLVLAGVASLRRARRGSQEA